MKPALFATLAGAWRGLWRFSAGQRGALGSAVLLLIAAELMRLPQPWLAGEAVNVLQRDAAAGTAGAARWLGLLFGLVVLAWVCHGAARVLERNVALHARQALALEIMHRLLRAPLAWHRREHPLAVAQRAMQGTQGLNEFAESQYIYVQTVIRIGGPVVALALLAPGVGLAAGVGLALLVAISLGFDRVLLRLGDARNAADRRNAATWGELLVHVTTLLALRLETGVLALVRQRLAAVLAPLGRQVLVNEAKWGAIDVLGHAYWCGLVVLYVVQAEGPLALGAVFMVYEYARRAEGCIATLASDFGVLASQLSAWHSAAPLLAAPAADAAVALAPTGWSRLDLQDVAVQRDGHVLLDGVTLRLERGRRYALVGPSGAGKSTLLAVLAGLEPASSGHIACNGEPVPTVRLRHEATLIPAAAAVFAGTVRENLAPGDDAADATRLRHALDLVGLGEFVARMPLGLDHAVGNGAPAWSSGQQQRLALARASLASAGSSLLLLDEPTAHLDLAAAHAVLRALLGNHRDACVVAALHDPVLACHFDACIRIADGRVTVDPLPATLAA